MKARFLIFFAVFCIFGSSLLAQPRITKFESRPFEALSYGQPTDTQEEIQTVVSDRGVLLASWTNNSYRVDGNTRVATDRDCTFSISSDNGRSWSLPVKYINPKYSASGNPSVAAGKSGLLYVICMSTELYNSGSLDITTSSDDGRHWSDWQTIFETRHGFPDKPWIFAHKNDVYVAWSNMILTGNGLDEKSELTFLGSKDGGKTWSQPKVISISGPNANSVQGANIFVADSGKIFVSWGEYNGGPISLAVSDDRGETFSKPKAIAKGTLSIFPPVTRIAGDAAGNHLFVTWSLAHDFGKISGVSSNDGGETWSLQKSICEYGQKSVATFDKDNRLHLIWNETQKDKSEGNQISGVSFLGYAIYDDFAGDPLLRTNFLTSSVLNLAVQGSYQSLSITRDGAFHAYTLGNTISHTSWRFER